MRWRFEISGTNSPGRFGRGGRVGVTLFLLIWLAMSLFFVAAFGRSVWKAQQTRSWPSVPAVILASQVEPSADGYRFVVRYRYAQDGNEHESRQFRPDPREEDSHASAQRYADRYPVGAQVHCRVNPADPQQAFLETPSGAAPLVMLFPLLFVLIGVGGLWLVWRKPNPQGPAPAMAANHRQLVPKLFFLCFAVVGAVLFWFLCVRVVWKVQAARDWPTVPCVVESSRVRSHRSDDGTTYSVDILYRYELAGRTYRSSRYNFLGGSSSGQAGKAAIVGRYPVGLRTECFVNPADPSEAVLERGFTASMWLGLFPLVFLFVGVGGLWAQRRGGAWAPKPVVPAPAALGPVVLKPALGAAGKFFAMIVVALFWNGIVSVFVAEAIGGWQKQRPDYTLSLFLIPFVLVGLGLIGGIVYFGLALFNPRPRLSVSSRSVAVGGRLDLQWQLSERARQWDQLQIWLEGCEQATYPSGKNNATDTFVFATVPILDTTNPWDMQQGRAQVMIPPATMHSFRASHNKVIWRLKVRGQIPRWPDLKEEYEIEVLPA